VTKNSILLVDYTIINQEEGKPQYQAVQLLYVCLRPILMTSLAVVELYRWRWNWGRAEVQPDGDCDYGWLYNSTPLTLVVVPVLFTYVDTSSAGWS